MDVAGVDLCAVVKLNSYLLGLHVHPGDWITEHTVRFLSAGLAARSNGTAGAAGRAVGLVAGGVRLEAYSLAFIDAFHLMVWAPRQGRIRPAWRVHVCAANTRAAHPHHGSRPALR